MATASRLEIRILPHHLPHETCIPEGTSHGARALVCRKETVMQTQHNAKITTNEARQGERTGLIWILTAGTLVAIMGLGAVMLAQAI